MAGGKEHFVLYLLVYQQWVQYGKTAIKNSFNAKNEKERILSLNNFYLLRILLYLKRFQEISKIPVEIFSEVQKKIPYQDV